MLKLLHFLIHFTGISLLYSTAFNFTNKWAVLLDHDKKKVWTKKIDIRDHSKIDKITCNEEEIESLFLLWEADINRKAFYVQLYYCLLLMVFTCWRGVGRYDGIFHNGISSSHFSVIFLVNKSKIRLVNEFWLIFVSNQWDWLDYFRFYEGISIGIVLI